MSTVGYVYPTPINVYFEATIACDLVCKHCRAEAVPEPSPMELTTEEAKELFRDVKQMGSHLVISGGDPLKREDLFELLDFARGIELVVAVTPTTSPLASFEKIKRMQELGIHALGVSLDGADRQAQDRFRGAQGTFDNSMKVLNHAKKLNIPVQVNTTCTGETTKEIQGIYTLLRKAYSQTVRRWSIFFLVPVGRGTELDLPTDEETMEVFTFLHEKSKEAPFHITTTEAPHFKTFFCMKELESGRTKEQLLNSGRRMGFGVRDGNGVVFVSFKGDIYPAGFLPFRVANVIEEKLSEIYANHEVMKALRDPSLFKGKCGVCPFKCLCGGSRARAYAMKGDFLEEDPLCHFSEEELQGFEYLFVES